MKRILTAIALMMVLICGGASVCTVQAQNKHHSSSKRSHAPASPVGHTYELADSDKHVTLEFKSEETVVLSYNVDNKTNTLDLSWSQEGNEIKIPNLEALKIVKGGRKLIEATGKEFVRIK